MSHLSETFEASGFPNIATLVAMLETETGKLVMYLGIELSDPETHLDIGNNTQSPYEYFADVATQLKNPDMRHTISRLDAACGRFLETDSDIFLPLSDDFFERATLSLGNQDEALFDTLREKLAQKKQ